MKSNQELEKYTYTCPSAGDRPNAVGIAWLFDTYEDAIRFVISHFPDDSPFRRGGALCVSGEKGVLHTIAVIVP